MPSPDHHSAPPTVATRWLSAATAAFRDRPARAAILTVWPLAGLLLLGVSVWALNYADRWRPTTQMTAVVFHEGTEPVATRVVTSLEPEQLALEAGLDPQKPFEVEWRGLLVAEEAGTHRLRVRADDGVAMWVGDEPILDERDHFGEQHVTAPVGLAEGLHKFRLRYIQQGGAGLIRLSWARPYSREEFHPVPIVLDTDPPPLYRRMAKADRYPRQVAAAWSVWVVVGLALGGIWLVEGVAGARLLGVLTGPQVVTLLLVSGALLGANLHVGLLPFRGWAPDEVMPRDVYFAGASKFTDGWYHQYPALSFYLLSLVNAPFTLFERLGRLSYADPVVYSLVHLVDRGVILACAMLTCLTLPFVTARTAGPRASMLAPYLLMGVPIVAFYSKTTNVDAIYTFWIVVAALAFVTAVTRRTIASHAWLGLAAAAAVAAKDQAYGFFPGAALVLLAMAWRQAPGRSAERLRRTLTDRPLWTGLLTFAAAYTALLGIWWNPAGVREHFGVITGQASTPFRMFPRTVAGTAELVGTTSMLLGLAVGPVVAIGAMLGIGVTASERGSRPALLLAAMPLGYFVTFLGVVGYVYDRFLLAAVPFVVLLAVRGIEWALDHVRDTTWQRVARALTLAACLYPAVATNARLAWDSRFGVESWMRENLTKDPSVLAVGSALYLPNLYPYQHRIVPSASIREILSWDADVLVLNEDWLERPGQPSDETIDRELFAAGYRKAYATGRTPAPAGLGALLASGLSIDPLYSNIAKTSPPISIWVRPTANAGLSETGAAEPDLGSSRASP